MANESQSFPSSPTNLDNTKSERLVKLGEDDSLDRWIKYVYGDLKCKCNFAYKGLGRQDGIDMGKGWVRITTHPYCPHHQEKKRNKR